MGACSGGYSGRDRRQWADVALILTGLGLFGLAVWFPPFSTTSDASQAIRLWPFYALAGGLVLIGLFLGQKLDWVRVARLSSSLLWLRW